VKATAIAKRMRSECIPFINNSIRVYTASGFPPVVAKERKRVVLKICVLFMLTAVVVSSSMVSCTFGV
jgi:hypothetical protein